MMEDRGAEKVAGFCDSVDVCWLEGPVAFSRSTSDPAELGLPSGGMDFLRKVEALLPILFRCTGELDSSS